MNKIILSSFAVLATFFSVNFYMTMPSILSTTALLFGSASIFLLIMGLGALYVLNAGIEDNTGYSTKNKGNDTKSKNAKQKDQTEKKKEKPALSESDEKFIQRILQMAAQRRLQFPPAPSKSFEQRLTDVGCISVVPERYKDPVTLKIMVDPIIAYTKAPLEPKIKHIYDISTFLTFKGTCPKTGQRFFDVKIDMELKGEIFKFVLECERVHRFLTERHNYLGKSQTSLPRAKMK